MSPDQPVDLYGTSYGGFAEAVYAEVRREAYGDEVGQASWLTREELDRFGSDLGLEASSRLLEVASGSGGPTLHLARSTGCDVVGIDVSEEGVANANGAPGSLAVRQRSQSAAARTRSLILSCTRSPTKSVTSKALAGGLLLAYHCRFRTEAEARV